MHATTRPPRLDPVALREWLAQSDAPRVIDVRTPAEFETAHIPGSYNVPLHLLREHSAEIAGHLDPASPHPGSRPNDVVLVCRSGMRAAQAEQAFVRTGLPNVHLLEGGITAWEQQAAPVTRGRARWDIERQVRLVAGSIVFVAVMGGLLLPGLQYLAAVIGAGLAVAALTNTCAMGMLLARLPYNRGASCDLDTVVDRLRTGTAR
jgi:rhodanese-related sulfurtransferase